MKCRYCGSSTKPPTNPLAVWALLGNLLGVPIGTVIAVVCGRRAIEQIDASGGRQGGRGLAQAGIVWAWCAAAIVGVLLFSVLVSRASHLGSSDAPRGLTPTEQEELFRSERQGRIASALILVDISSGMSRDMAFDTACWDSIQDTKAMIYSQVAALRSLTNPSETDIARAYGLAADWEDADDRQWYC